MAGRAVGGRGRRARGCREFIIRQEMTAAARRRSSPSLVFVVTVIFVFVVVWDGEVVSDGRTRHVRRVDSQKISHIRVFRRLNRPATTGGKKGRPTREKG